MHYIENRSVYDAIRQAYIGDHITRDQLLDLQCQVRDGDGYGARQRLKELIRYV